MAGEGGMLKFVKPKIQSVDIQAAAGWGFAAAAGAIWLVQPFDWIKKTFIEKPAAEESEKSPRFKKELGFPVSKL